MGDDRWRHSASTRTIPGTWDTDGDDAVEDAVTVQGGATASAASLASTRAGCGPADDLSLREERRLANAILR